MPEIPKITPDKTNIKMFNHEAYQVSTCCGLLNQWQSHIFKFTKGQCSLWQHSSKLKEINFSRGLLTAGITYLLPTTELVGLVVTGGDSRAEVKLCAGLIFTQKDSVQKCYIKRKVVRIQRHLWRNRSILWIAVLSPLAYR